MLSISIENYQSCNITNTNIQFYNTFAILQITVAFLQLSSFLNENADIIQLMRMNTGKAKNDFYIFVYISHTEN